MRPKGFGYAEFTTPDDLRKALALNEESFFNRNIRIRVADPRTCPYPFSPSPLSLTIEQPRIDTATRATATSPTGLARAPWQICPAPTTVTVAPESSTSHATASSVSPASPVPLAPTTPR